MFRLLIIQQDPQDPPGLIDEWVRSRKITAKTVHLYKGDVLPSLGEVDGILPLGGPMNVDQHEKHPWLIKEKEFLTSAVRAGTKILGICLGGQLLARCLGASVKKHVHREIGWHQVHKVAGVETNLKPGYLKTTFEKWPTQLRVFQYHEDRFEIPKGAQKLLTNSACDNQAFAFGENVMALQFHPEATLEWAAECYAGLAQKGEEPFVQEEAEAKAFGLEVSASTKAAFFNLLDGFFLSPNGVSRS